MGKLIAVVWPRDPTGQTQATYKDFFGPLFEKAGITEVVWVEADDIQDISFEGEDVLGIVNSKPSDRLDVPFKEGIEFVMSANVRPVMFGDCRNHDCNFMFCTSTWLLRNRIPAILFKSKDASLVTSTLKKDYPQLLRKRQVDPFTLPRAARGMGRPPRMGLC